ncbi:thioredoxin reductase 1, cytoplasmic-like isoform X1 [Acipenser oxyrinchus oxyrinchus]|uniref:Thioredoxin reductase 1, cytoplasmic n=1 Tax=Acipenser oxyrinchus oxyrinchus TaxID=40147 RepID=A0AAD8DFM8_ACIOX|nr:thioredoxin reductase 1, cytoplasmic-like isoform X1 [Acipenser oxyrinchus oxyrinchus]
MGNSVCKGKTVFMDTTRIKSLQNSSTGVIKAGEHKIKSHLSTESQGLSCFTQDHSDQRDGRKIVQGFLGQNKVMIFSVTSCQLSAQVKELFRSMDVSYCVLELDQREDRQEIQQALWELTEQRELPSVFVNRQHIGDWEKTSQAHREGRLQALLNMQEVNLSPDLYDYDLLVIGGGSGGLAAAKEAATYGKKVVVLDYVTPTPKGTTWGLGGTCVNVGCIPKKLMHQAAILGQAIRDSQRYGWELQEKVSHNWSNMRQAVQDHIGSLRFGYSKALRDSKVTYVNAYGEFVGPHQIKATNSKGKETFYTAATFIIATGERPRYLGIPGDKEYCITSDDLFSLPQSPSRTLVVGASYVALECAGFLAGLGLDISVMVRSILLRGFDQHMASKIGEHMEQHGVTFIRQFVPTKIERLEEGSPDKLKVTAKSTDGKETFEGEYNTVLLAVGRDACTRTIGLDTVGVKINVKTGKIPVNEEEQTNVPHIYAIGDVLEGKLELTPVAIQAGRLLARRLYAEHSTKCDYTNVPTTVFTPLEYGACGLSEEDSIQKYGEDNIEVYHSNFWPLEWTVPARDNNTCYAKIICHKQDSERVVGFHVLGPNSGEMTQGFAAAMKCGMTKEQLDNTIGIHPVCAEVFTTLSVTKRSGGDIAKGGC